MGGNRGDGDSSSDEDGDEQWRAAINSVAAGVLSSTQPRPVAEPKPHKPTHFQLKLQKALHDMLEDKIEMVRSRINSLDEESTEYGVRLFKRAPAGIVFDHQEKMERPKRKPRIMPGEEPDDKSKKFRKQVLSVVLEGRDIIAGAEDVGRKILGRIRAKQAAAKEAAEKEAQRVAELKRIRGERWLPSIAKQMKLQLKTTPKRRC